MVRNSESALFTFIILTKQINRAPGLRKSPDQRVRLIYKTRKELIPRSHDSECLIFEEATEQRGKYFDPASGRDV